MIPEIPSMEDIITWPMTQLGELLLNFPFIGDFINTTDGPSTTQQHATLVSSMLCAMCIVFMGTGMPTPPMMMMACLCCSCCLSSTGKLVQDIQKTDDEEESA